MESITGWVQWRDAPGQPARFRWGTLEYREGLAFRDQSHPQSGPWITPGLVDVHAHLAISPSGTSTQSDIDAAAAATIESGVLAIREPGSPVRSDPDSKLTVIKSGRHLARPRRYLRGLALEVESPSELMKAVAEQAQAGDGWVKLVGDWIDRSRGAESTVEPLWETKVLIDAVDVAHAHGARVAVHAFSRDVIDSLLDARVDSIEHGSGMTREHAQEAAHRGIPVTPTLGQVELFPEFARTAAAKYPRYAATMDHLYHNRHQWFGWLLEEGVQLLPGTDAGGYQPHASLRTELERWREYGASPETIIESATWRARDFLGLDSLHPGSHTALVVFPTQPVLSQPSQIIWC